MTESGGGFCPNVQSHTSSVASDWLMSFTSWLGDWVAPPRLSGGRSDGARVAESLVTELVQQGRVLEEQQRQAEREAATANSAVDYSWLVTEKPPAYDINDVQRLELEQLCQHVAPESCSRVIHEFRSALLRRPSPADLPAIMRAIALRVIREQQDACASEMPSASLVGGVSQWLGRSLTSLRSRLGGSTANLSGAGETLELSVNDVDSMNSMELGSLDNDCV